MSKNKFSSLPLTDAQLSNLESLGYQEMTPVQAQSLPLILDKKDVIVQAKTGSGKTAAFGLGLLQTINPRFFGAQALVLCPTRELADQVAKEIRQLARCTDNIKLVVLCGGKPVKPQADSLAHGGHIIVGTPGRIKDHLERQTLQLDQVETLVLDEADRMLDMGFYDDIIDIISHLPRQRQTLMFSATYPASIDKMTRSIMQKPITIKIDSEHEPDVIEQVFYLCNTYQRMNTLLSLLGHYQLQSTVIFCDTKIQCNEVGQFLQGHKISSLVLHGDLEQRDREEVLVRFSNASANVLVATDVAARGLDIKALQAVINYELPHDPEIYVHRIGRTGRAGEKGLALSLYSEDEIPRIISIEAYTKNNANYKDVKSLDGNATPILEAKMVTIQIDSGKKNKIRPGDILGALTKDAGLKGAQIGKIDIFPQFSFVAIERSAVTKALRHFKQGKVKGRHVRAREVG